MLGSLERGEVNGCARRPFIAVRAKRLIVALNIKIAALGVAPDFSFVGKFLPQRAILSIKL